MTTKKTAAATVKTAAKKMPAKKVPAPAKAAAKKPKKEHKEKVVRDSFTMPQGEYRKIDEIKEVCLKAGLPVKKSEVLRAGLKTLNELNATQLKRALAGLEKIKAGRSKKP